MENLNHKLLRSTLDDKENKSIMCRDCEDIQEQYRIVLTHLDGLIQNRFSKHELAQWINSINIYVTKKEMNVNYNYKTRSLVYAQLGTNIGDEISYEHAAIILKVSDVKIFIVPCSSSDKAKERQKSEPTIFLLGTTADGFIKDTVVYINDARWISKSRIVSSSGIRIKKELYDTIYNMVHENLFRPKVVEANIAKKNIKQKENEIIKLKSEIDKLEAKLESVTKERDDYFLLLDNQTQ